MMLQIKFCAKSASVKITGMPFCCRGIFQECMLSEASVMMARFIRRHLHLMCVQFHIPDTKIQLICETEDLIICTQLCIVSLQPGPTPHTWRLSKVYHCQSLHIIAMLACRVIPQHVASRNGHKAGLVVLQTDTTTHTTIYKGGAGQMTGCNTFEGAAS